MYSQDFGQVLFCHQQNSDGGDIEPKALSPFPLRTMVSFGAKRSCGVGQTFFCSPKERGRFVDNPSNKFGLCTFIGVFGCLRGVQRSCITFGSALVLPIRDFTQAKTHTRRERITRK